MNAISTVQLEKMKPIQSLAENSCNVSVIRYTNTMGFVQNYPMYSTLLRH